MCIYKTHSTRKKFSSCHETLRDDVVATSSCFMVKLKCRLVWWGKEIKHKKKRRYERRKNALKRVLLERRKYSFMTVGISVPYTWPFFFRTLLLRVQPCSGCTWVYWSENDLQKWHTVNFYVIYWGLQCAFSPLEDSGSYVRCNDVPMT